MDSAQGCSAKLKNPGTSFFLQLAAGALRDANNQGDKSDVSYAGETMIRTGMDLNLNGL